jgi:hypothetical protein
LNRKKPGRTGYVVAAVLFVLGTIGAAVLATFFILGIVGLGGSLERVVVPGTERLYLEETGRYTIYYEYRSEVDGVTYRTDEDPPNLETTVTRLETGETIPVQSRSGLTTYDVGSRSGVSYQAFRVDDPGEYEITAEYPPGQSGPDVVLAIGEGVEGSIFASVGAFFGAGLLFCGTTLIALVIVAVTLIRRSRNEPTETPSQTA